MATSTSSKRQALFLCIVAVTLVSCNNPGSTNRDPAEERLAREGINIAPAPAISEPHKMIPGRGIGELRLGMPMKTFADALGDPYKTRTYQDERAEALRDKTNPDELRVFQKKFDTCNYYSCHADSTLPVFKVYFNDSKLAVYMQLTDVYAKNLKDNDFITPEGVDFSSTKEKVILALGAPNRMRNDKSGDVVFSYDPKGVSVSIKPDNKGISFIDIYPPGW